MIRYLIAAALIVATVMGVVLLSVQYGRALESCHSDGTTRVPITGCDR